MKVIYQPHFFNFVILKYLRYTSTYVKIRKNDAAFVIFWSTVILICQTSPITLCSISCDLERQYVVFASPVSQKGRRQPISFILDSLSVQMLNIL